ncbi:polymorphic toxin type 24 domain-containing protein [Streptomyces sp. NPDC102270]|uniref:polymorphic toxin type 24 domain-containing protein n=1 Tax=Streptomyces sp. NPDC102270 TaxID=3366150 RepID=UPI0038082388
MGLTGPGKHPRRFYKTDPQTGKVTNYTTYDSEGRAVKRVDLEGRPHGGVDTPHVVEYERNTNPKTGQVFVRPSNEVRAAFPWEIP